MDLIIHCGLHKTATTSFQSICASNRPLLAELGIHYPAYNGTDQHSFVLWDAATQGWHVFEGFLKRAVLEAADRCRTVLLSGEDFENAIFDRALAHDIETAAADSGFDRVRWVVVTRDPLQYARSLYSEKSKHDVVLNYLALMEIARTRGVFFVSTSNYDYIFVLDYQRFSERFKSSVAGAVIEFEMREFTDGFAGRALLGDILSPPDFARFAAEAEGIHDRPANQSMSDRETEYGYAANAFVLGARVRRGRLKRALARLLWPLMKARLEVRQRVDRDIARRLEHAADEPPPAHPNSR